MNLNEECLLQFLTGGPGEIQGASVHNASSEGSLVSDINRIHRRSQFVSFPSAILVRRTEQD